MLSGSDLRLIVVTTIACTAIITGLGYLALRWNRRGSIASQVVIVVAAALLSVAASTLAVLVEMLFSAHDITVLACVLGVSAVLSLAAAWFITGRAARASITDLVTSAQRIADGNVVPATDPGWREFNQLAAELADTSQRLTVARGEIDKLDSARRQFFAWISHDLRTPLAGIRAMAEALEEGVAGNPEAYVRQIRVKVDTVNAMVDDLFELSKLESGTLRLRPELVPLLDLVSDAVADVQPIAVRRGITIRAEQVAGHMLWADPRELTRAIGNLLSNAVRHAPDDSTVVVTADNLPHQRLTLSVLDEGPGVAVEDLSSIFAVGWRGDPARTAGDAGAGLGLAIVRGIVEAHGGNVRADHVDGGFRMAVVLPIGQPAHRP